MLQQTLSIQFKDGLEKVIKEINAYQDPEAIWRVDKGIANSAGNLALHLVGNLNTYIGAELGKSGYVRNRDLEFSAKGIPATQLVRMLEDTIPIVERTISHLTNEQLDGEYPLKVFKEKTSTEYFMVHLATHLNYHLGQINYHRRLLDRVPASAAESF